MYIKEEHIEKAIENKKLDKGDRVEIKQMAREAAQFVMKGGDPRDLPKALRIE